jgi:hypothetical protein
MENAERELVTRLFTYATELIEDSHSTATRGQSNRRRISQYLLDSEKLQYYAQDLNLVASMISLIVKRTVAAENLSGKNVRKTELIR